ncbi:PepSY domain-containing protein [Idiomarina sp. HP20-50]|uniref:PepSY domain-containing protein n=1 Tax=Idiomarina sp. HP20-50 TaxID=3070813 RepID=UPI00294AA90B|nr:PepSY domain-containing protein [Idiomarina sp. HP20-50]MDV6316610.1 PepSY domain-containing protein [Idiomarina sp. HP20-50]
MNPRKWRSWHRWLSLIVGLQLVIWSISGAYMVFFDLSFIHGDHLVKKLEQPLEKNTTLSPISWVLDEKPEATSVRLMQQWVDGSLRAVYRVESKAGTQLLLAESLEPITLDRMDIGYIASQHFANNKDVKAQVSFVEDKAPGELNPALLPVWRVDFNDFSSPTLYFSAATGELVTKRHDFWRLFDFFWMLHIMDYEHRIDIQTWWLKAFTIANILFLVSGGALLYFHFRPRKKRRRAA